VSASPSPVATATGSSTPVAGGTSTTFNGHGVSFQYPASWQSLQLDTSGASSQGTPIWTETFGPDTANFATVAQYTQAVAITPSNIDQHSAEITTQIQNLFSQAGGSMQSGPVKLTMAGFPALGYSGTAVNSDATSVKNRLVLAYNNTTEYLVDCQSTGTDTTAFDAGCNQIVTTFSA